MLITAKTNTKMTSLGDVSTMSSLGDVSTMSSLGDVSTTSNEISQKERPGTNAEGKSI